MKTFQTDTVYDRLSAWSSHDHQSRHTDDTNGIELNAISKHNDLQFYFSNVK